MIHGEAKSGLYVASLLVGLVAVVAGFSIYQMAEQLPNNAPPGAGFTASKQLLGQRRPDFSLPDLEGKLTSISRWDGQVVLVNFWATWCPPCRKEIPGFAELLAHYGKRGFQVIGVAIDRPKAVAQFTGELGIDYPQLVGRAAGAVTDRYGNQQGALPYSVLIDRKGVIRFIKLGALHKSALKAELSKLL
jgi:peroxiredoxin